LPFVSNFIEFWENSIIEEEDEIGLELSEINTLFKIWSKTQINIKQQLILDLIKHYYPEIIIEEDKYILNITCSLWNKKDDINKILNEIKLEFNKKMEKYPIAIDYLYDKYCIYKKNNLIINKKYFKKYVKEILSNVIDHDNLILPDWWNNINYDK
jgi:hypothetical protein